MWYIIVYRHFQIYNEAWNLWQPFSAGIQNVKNTEFEAKETFLSEPCTANAKTFAYSLVVIAVTGFQKEEEPYFPIVDSPKR